MEGESWRRKRIKGTKGGRKEENRKLRGRRDAGTPLKGENDVCLKGKNISSIIEKYKCVNWRNKLKYKIESSSSSSIQEDRQLRDR